MPDPSETLDQDRRGFRDELIRAGLLRPTGVDGLYQRAGAFESIVRGIEGYVSRAGAHEGATALFFPPIMAREGFERTDYLRSFPDLLGAIEVFRGGDAEHVALMSAMERGEDWTRYLEPSEVTMCSAACHQLYPTLSESDVPAEGLRFEVQGYCFRHEPSIDPARMQSFRMHEFVYVGDPEAAIAHRDTWLDRGMSLLTDLGLELLAEEANDPFFGRAGRMLAANQRAAAQKFEITCVVSSEDARTAIASANYHDSHFGEGFGIRTPDGAPAHSACAGFGLERIALALVRRHGTALDGWPADVRTRLWS